MTHRQRPLLFITLLTGFTSCAAVGPDYKPPSIETPEQFGHTQAATLTSAEIARWWTTFSDPHLTALVEEVLADNLDLAAAVERVDAVRALLGVARADFLPSLDAAGSYLRSRPFGVPNSSTQNQWSIGGDVSWEIDLFGRVRRNVEAASATLEFQVEDLRAVQVALAAETVVTYLQLVSLQERLEIARRNVGSQEESRGLANERFRAGMTAGLDPAQAELNLFSTQANVPGLELELRRARHRLAVLRGHAPRSLEGSLDDALADSRVLPEPPTELLVGVPADLLRNRPDIRSAERQLAAQSAQVGAAMAARYPSINLAGSWDWLASTPGDLFDDSFDTGSIGPFVSLPIFNGGRLRSNIEAEEATLRQLDRLLRQRVLVAQEEVENALIAIVKDRRRTELLRNAAGAARRSVDLSRQLYTSGQSNFQNVLDAERSLFSLEDSVALARLTVLLDMVDLYRALGGGWADGGDIDSELKGAPTHSADATEQ